MEYFVKSGNPEKQRVACVIVGIFDRRTLSVAAETLDKASDGAIGSVMRRGDMDGKIGTTLVLHNVPGTFADRVMLVGLGRERSFDEAAFRKAVTASSNALRATGAIDACSYLTHVPVKNRDFHWNIGQAVLATEDAWYRFDDCRGAKAREDLLRLVMDERGSTVAGGGGGDAFVGRSRLADDLVGSAGAGAPGHAPLPREQAPAAAQGVAVRGRARLDARDRFQLHRLGWCERHAPVHHLAAEPLLDQPPDADVALADPGRGVVHGLVGPGLGRLGDPSRTLPALVPVLRSIDPRQRQAAATLGASPLRSLAVVDLPVAWRPALAAAGLAFAVSLGEFGATSFLARSDRPTLPVVIFRLIGLPGGDNLGMALAASVVLAAANTRTPSPASAEEARASRRSSRLEPRPRPAGSWPPRSRSSST